MKKTVLSFAIFLLAASAWAAGEIQIPSKLPSKPEVREAEAQRTAKSQLLYMVALAASMFARDVGCAPGAATDLMAQPSPDRLRALGCGPGRQVRGEYLPPSPSLREAARGLAFVRRWDGLMVIEFPQFDGSKGQCTFLDAEHSECKVGWPALSQGK